MGFQSEINKTIALGGATAGILKKVQNASPGGEVEEPKMEKKKMEKPNIPTEQPKEKKPYEKPSMEEYKVKNQVYLGPEPDDVNALKDKLLLKQIQQQKAIKERMANLRKMKAEKNKPNVLIKL